MADFSPTVTYVPVTLQVSNILYHAYRLANALLNPGQGISQSEITEGMMILNLMLNSWKIEPLLVEYERRTVQNMLEGQRSYSVGPSQDFDLERPEAIERAGFIVGTGQNEAEVPMYVLRTYQEWANFIAKNVEASIPLVLYYVPAVPFGQAIIWPIPSQDSQIAIYTRQQMTQFATPDDNVIVRDGVPEMMIYNLAVKVHEYYPNRKMDPSVARTAIATKANVKGAQYTPTYISADPAASQGDANATWFGGRPQAWVPPWYR